MDNFLSILQSLTEFDHWLFRKINSQWTNGLFDFIYPYFRESNLWMPLYLFIFAFVAANFRRNWWWWIIFFVCTVALTDMIGTNVFKHVFKRLRPCNDPEFASYVRLLLKNCAGGFSFVSNHAANHFGMATFFFFTLRSYFPKVAWIAFLWAVMVCYAQIYVGIHYPLDIAGGAVLGIVLGVVMAAFFNRRFGFANFGTEPTVTT